MDNIKLVALDMDGVMRIGKQAVPGIHPLLERIKQKGLRAIVVTNECRFTEGKIRHDFYDMKINWPDEWPIYTSANSIRDFLVKMFNKPKFGFKQKGISRKTSSGVEMDGSVGNLHDLVGSREGGVERYIGVVGERGIREGVKEAIRQVDRGIKMANLPPFEREDCELYLVIGTLYNLDITDLEKALKWIQRGAKVVVSCPDITDPELKGDFSICMPRHVLHMVRLNAGTDYYCVGKPNALMARAIKHHFPGIPFEEVLFVGDSLDTDIKLAEENGMVSALVLTGNAQIGDLVKSCVQPDIVVKDLVELADML